MKRYLVVASLILMSLISFGCSEEPVELWPHGVVGYHFDDSVRQSIRDLFYEAMARWAEAGVCFVEMDGPREYVVEIVLDENHTFCGTLGRKRDSYILVPYGYSRSIAHELGHTLGLYHEHQRPDRDEYVTILWENVASSWRDDFKRMDNPFLREKDFPYDYSSVMHYFHWAGSKGNGEKLSTIVPVDETINENDLGGLSISDLDLAKVEAMYREELSE